MKIEMIDMFQFSAEVLVNSLSKVSREMLVRGSVQ
jgi:hypothetical protein